MKRWAGVTLGRSAAPPLELCAVQKRPGRLTGPSLTRRPRRYSAVLHLLLETCGFWRRQHQLRAGAHEVRIHIGLSWDGHESFGESLAHSPTTVLVLRKDRFALGNVR